MSNELKTREKVSISIDRGLMDRARDLMNELQLERMARGKKFTSFSRVMEAAITIGLAEDDVLREQVIEAAS